MVYSAKHREYQLVAKSTNSALFLTRVIFTMSVFHCGMPPLCPRNWKAQRKFGGKLKKNSGALRRSLCLPTSKPCRRLCPTNY